MTERIKNYVIAFTIVLIGVLYLTTIRPGANWGGDSFLYIKHAINIADGKKYDQTGYILNPYRISYNPRTLPPGFPLLLTPIYKIFGFNLLTMKVETGIIYLIFLSLLVPLLRQRMFCASLVGLLLILSLNPLILDFKFLIGSDIPFLLFTYWALLLIHKSYESGQPKTVFFPAVYLAVVIYLAYGTRSAGVALLPSLLVYEFINWGRISARTLITIGIFFLFAVIQWIFSHNDGDYIKIMIHNDTSFALRENLRGFFYFWDDNYHAKMIQIVLFLSLMFLAVSGFIAQVRRRVLVTETFFVIYCASIFTWPPAGFRYFLPVLPLFIFYFLCGMEFWGNIPVRPAYAFIRKVIFIVIMGLLLFSYESRYHYWDYRTIPEGPYKPESQELFKFIREKTPRDAVFIFRDPLCLAFFTGRQASIYHHPADQEELWQYMHNIGARYVIYARPLTDDQQYLKLFIERYHKQLKPVFINKDFQVFSVCNHPECG
jgi:hypothetical protein